MIDDARRWSIGSRRAVERDAARDGHHDHARAGDDPRWKDHTEYRGAGGDAAADVSISPEHAGQRGAAKTPSHGARLARSCAESMVAFSPSCDVGVSAMPASMRASTTRTLPISTSTVLTNHIALVASTSG